MEAPPGLVLVQRTELGRYAPPRAGYAYWARLFIYPDGTNELVATERIFQPQPDTRARRRRPRRIDGERTAESEERGARRAATAVRRYAKWNALDTMVTLTFPGNGVHGYDQAYSLVSGFIHKHGQLLHDGPYVAVPELHSGGHGFHFHILVSREFSTCDLDRMREGWTAYLARRGIHPSGGARWVRVNVRRGEPAVFARYAAKYVTKTFAEGEIEAGRQRYLTGQGHQPRPRTRWFACPEDVVAFLPDGVSVWSSTEDPTWEGPATLCAQWKGAVTLNPCPSESQSGMNGAHD